MPVLSSHGAPIRLRRPGKPRTIVLALLPRIAACWALILAAASTVHAQARMLRRQSPVSSAAAPDPWPSLTRQALAPRQANRIHDPCDTLRIYTQLDSLVVAIHGAGRWDSLTLARLETALRETGQMQLRHIGDSLQVIRVRRERELTLLAADLVAATQPGADAPRPWLRLDAALVPRSDPLRVQRCDEVRVDTATISGRVIARVSAQIDSVCGRLRQWASKHRITPKGDTGAIIRVAATPLELRVPLRESFDWLDADCPKLTALNVTPSDTTVSGKTALALGNLLRALCTNAAIVANATNGEMLVRATLFNYIATPPGPGSSGSELSRLLRLIEAHRTLIELEAKRSLDLSLLEVQVTLRRLVREARLTARGRCADVTLPWGILILRERTLVVVETTTVQRVPDLLRHATLLATVGRASMGRRSAMGGALLLGRPTAARWAYTPYVGWHPERWEVGGVSLTRGFRSIGTLMATPVLGAERASSRRALAGVHGSWSAGPAMLGVGLHTRGRPTYSFGVAPGYFLRDR